MNGDTSTVLDTNKTARYFRSIHDSAMVNGHYMKVSAMSVDTFISVWKDRWADSLVRFHPEYCYYRWCEMNSASNYYDDSMLNTNSFDTAYARGYFSPMSHDPYFKNGGKGRSQKNWMTAVLADFTDSAGFGNNISSTVSLSLEELVIGMA